MCGKRWVIPKAILVEELQRYYLANSREDKGWVHTFPKGICPKVNVIAQMEFEIAYFEVQHFNHNVSPHNEFFHSFSLSLSLSLSSLPFHLLFNFFLFTRTISRDFNRLILLDSQLANITTRTHKLTGVLIFT